MFILGLTGSVGMGKSTSAAMFRRLGVPVYDADAAVHAIFKKGGAAVEPVRQAFGDVVKNGAVDRPALGRKVYEDADALRRLESIVHPLVRRIQMRFLKRQSARRVPRVLLDIPLLFETGGEAICDSVAVVSAPAFIQRQRVLRRPGIDEKRFAAMRKQQMPDPEKRKRADYIIPTGLGKRVAFDAIIDILGDIEGDPGRVWPDRVLLAEARRKRDAERMA